MKNKDLFRKEVLLYSLIFFIAWVIIGPLIDHNFTFEFVYEDSFPIKVIVFILLSLLAGMIVGYRRK